MKTSSQDGHHLVGPVKDDPQASRLTRQLTMAHAINSRARSLLNADTQGDAVSRTLEKLKEIAGMAALSIFKKQADESGGIAIEWCCQTGRESATGSAWESYLPDRAVCKQLAAKQTVRVTWPQTENIGHGVTLDEGGPFGLIMPINVFGTWWGGLCLDCGATDMGEDTPVFESFTATADFLGVFFERQIASREHTESDKLAGALEMAGTVCHKLNQPMQVILGYASMVTSGDISDPDQVCDIVKMIEDETRRMGIITKNLMGITKYRTVETPDVGSMCDVDSPRAIP